MVLPARNGFILRFSMDKTGVPVNKIQRQTKGAPKIWISMVEISKSLCCKKIWSKYWTANVCYICQGIVGCTPIPTYPYRKSCALTTWRHWPDHLLSFSVSKANLFQISQQRRILTLRAAVVKLFKCRSAEKGAFQNMATLRSPGLKVKLLVGPTCKIPTINSKERLGNKAITDQMCQEKARVIQPLIFQGQNSPLRFLKVKVLLMAEILHQLRLVVYPIIFRVSAPSQVVQDFSHQ